MSIPVVEIEHKTVPVLFQCNKQDNCGWAASNACAGEHNKPHAFKSSCELPCRGSECTTIQSKCAPDCPACAAEKHNKAWAKWVASNQKGSIILSETTPFTGHYVAVVHIPISDWEQIKKLAEEG